MKIITLIIMTIMLTIIITIMKNNNDSKSNSSKSSNNDNNQSFANDNSDRSYDSSYVLLTQAFLKLAFCNYE